MSLKKEIQENLRRLHDKYLNVSKEKSSEEKKKYLENSFNKDMQTVAEILMGWQIIVGTEFTKKFIQDMFTVISMSEQVTDFAMNKVIEKMKEHRTNN